MLWTIKTLCPNEMESKMYIPVVCFPITHLQDGDIVFARQHSNESDTDLLNQEAEQERLQGFANDVQRRTIEVYSLVDFLIMTLAGPHANGHYTWRA